MIDNLTYTTGIAGFEEYNSTLPQTVSTVNTITIKNGYEGISEELKKKLMDKDRTMIGQMKTIKDNERKIQTLTKLNEDLEEKNTSMLNELNSFSIQQKYDEGIINNQKEEIQNLKSKTESSEAKLMKENDKMNKTIESLNNKLTLNDELMKRWGEENSKLLSSAKNKDLIIEENKCLIEKNDLYIQQLKTENKQIPSLKRQLNELEEIINDNKSHIMNIQAQYDMIVRDKEKMEYELIQGRNEKKVVKEETNSNDQIKFEYELIKKENEALNKVKTELTSKNQTIRVDFDSFVNTVIKQIGIIANEIETGAIVHNNFNKKSIIKNETVGDLIQKSLAILTQSITTKLKSNEEQIDNTSKALKEIESINLSLANDKSSLVKSNALLTNKNTQYSSQHKEQTATLNNITKDFLTLKDSYVSLKGAYQKLTQQMEQIAAQTQLFLDSLLSKLYPDKGDKLSNLSISEKIFEGIDSIIQSNKELNEHLASYSRNKMVLTKEEYEAMINDKKSLMLEVNDSKRAIDNNISQMKSKEDDMIVKVRELNNLLNESNQLAIEYDNQVKSLKERNRKLENNLEMLTKSHYELEQAIGSHDSNLKVEKDILETKYISLLREIELKDIQIQSLEKLQVCEQKIINKPLIGKLVTRNTKKSNDSNLYNNTSPSEYQGDNNMPNDIFIRNEEKERELKEMFIQTGNSLPENNQTDSGIRLSNPIGKHSLNKN